MLSVCLAILASPFLAPCIHPHALTPKPFIAHPPQGSLRGRWVIPAAPNPQ